LLATLIVVSLPLLVSTVRAQETSPPAGEEEMELPPGVALGDQTVKVVFFEFAPLEAGGTPEA
jgi:hypothetical protein